MPRLARCILADYICPYAQIDTALNNKFSYLSASFMKTFRGLQ